MDLQGVRGEGLRVPRRSKSNVLYPFKPLLHGFRGPPVAPIDTLEASEFFLTFRGPRRKK